MKDNFELNKLRIDYDKLQYEVSCIKGKKKKNVNSY